MKDKNMKKLILIAFLLLSLGVMAQKQHINQTAPKDNLKQAFQKTNENFDELYSSRDSVADAMADTLQYLTNLDQSDLITLIDGNELNVGLLYFVTDRNWLLVAVADSVLKPVSGSITLINGDTLITGVEPEVLWIELPEYAYTSETPVVVDQSYYPTMMIVKNDNTEGDPSRAKLYSESSSTVIMGYNGDNATVSYGTTVIYFANESNLPSYVARDVYNISDESDVTAIILIKFERSQF